AVGPDWRSALDEVMDKLERQVKRYKERLGKRGVLRREAVVEFEKEEVEEPALPPVDKVARVKEFVLRPMSIEDAILQMELLGHTFFIFKDLDKNKVQVVYKREDGNYGLIDPIY
nr:HPF/RaiA family ribosome-associated protein [Candidatus Atribacteria bacterium]